MAIRFSMSQDTVLKNTDASQAQTPEKTNRRSGLQEKYFQSETAQSQLEEADRQADCDCTNISVMQLFYEMKQEFPTIPDYVVNQHVLDNCHDRENCKQQLQRELNQIAPVQTYPAQLLRILNKKPMCKKRLEPRNTTTTPRSDAQRCRNCNQNLLQNNGQSFELNDAIGSEHNITPTFTESAHNLAPDLREMRSGLCNIQIKTYLIDQNNFDLVDKKTPQLPPPAPQRPTTLRLNQEPYSRNHRADRNNHEFSSHRSPDSTKTGNRSPNSPSSSHESPSTPPFRQKSTGTSFTTTTSIQSPSSYPESRKAAEISVNVSLSPSSYRNRGPPQRHQATINVRPELPFTRNFESAGPNQKSYTSVNLVLRQPSSSPQSPIDITVGPNLTYSSSSYHAGLGYQNNYHITVTDDGGVFSAFRIRPVSYCNPSPRNSERDVNHRKSTSDLNAESASDIAFQNSVAKAAPRSSEQSEVCKIIMRQHNQMEKLSMVLRKNKNKLEIFRQEEKYVMQSANTDGLSERLDSEIEKLRCDCQAMLNEIENSGAYGLTEESIVHTNSIKSRQQQPFPKQRALPSISTSNCWRKQQRSYPIAPSPRQQSITYLNNDELYDYGEGRD